MYTQHILNTSNYTLHTKHITHYTYSSTHYKYYTLSTTHYTLHIPHTTHLQLRTTPYTCASLLSLVFSVFFSLKKFNCYSSTRFQTSEKNTLEKIKNNFFSHSLFNRTSQKMHKNELFQGKNPISLSRATFKSGKKHLWKTLFRLMLLSANDPVRYEPIHALQNDYKWIINTFLRNFGQLFHAGCTGSGVRFRHRLLRSQYGAAHKAEGWDGGDSDQ